MNRPQAIPARTIPTADIALLLLLSLLWGSSYPLIAVALATIPPVTLMAARVSIAATLLWLLLRATGRRHPLRQGDLGLLFIQSVLNASGAWLLLAWGQQFVPSATAGVLNSTSPVFVVLLTLALSGPRAIAPLKIVGAALGLAGVALTIGPRAFEGFGTSIQGELAVLGGAMLYGGAALNGRRIAHIPPLPATAWTLTLASIVLVPLALMFEQPWTIVPSARSLAAAAVLAVVCTALALQIYLRLIANLGALAASTQAYLRAGVAVGIGTLVMGEHLSPRVVAGLAVIIAGVAIINWPRTLSARKQAPDRACSDARDDSPKKGG